MRIRDILFEFAPSGGGDSGNYFQALASAWYNGTFDTGSLQKGIKSQEDVERLLNRGIVCPDGKTRKLHIDYNSDFDGVEIYSDDYYEYGDHDDTIDSRTGQKWGPYDFMAFSDEDLSEGLNEFVTPQAVAQDPGLEREKDVDVIFYGHPGKDYNAEDAWAALEEVLPAEYPPGSEKAQYKVAEVAKSGGAVVTTKPLSVAKQLVSTFTGYGIKSRIDGNLNEFAAGGDSGRWYTDDQMTDLVGDGWWQDMDVSGANIGVPDSEVPKKYMIQQAQRWLKRQGYSVQVLNCKANDDDMEWYIEGAFPKGLTEFAADDGDSGGEDDALHKYARMWWAGDEATQMQIEKVLARMGWEIGEDEGGYDNGGVFVVRAGDENGDSYTSWAAEDLTEGFARRPRPMNSFKLAQIGYTPDGPLPMADYSKYPTAVIIKAITDLNQDREKNPELIKLLTKELFKRRQQQGMAEGDLNEKSTSQAQFRTMAAAAHDPKFAKKVGIKQSVAREFNRADTGQDYKSLPKKATEGAPVTTTPGSIEPGGAVDNFKQQMANNTERDMAEGNRKPEPPEADYGDDYQDMVKRVKKLAGLGPLKTVYDSNKRVYKNVPTAVQPRK